VGKELRIVGDRIVGTRFQADVALVRDYDNEWDGELDRWHGQLQGKSTTAWFKALQYNHIPLDFIYLRQDSSVQDLLRYKTLIYPHPAILTEENAQLLKEYTAQGGTVVFGPRTGYKDISGKCRMIPMPGLVADLCGVTVEDFTMIGSLEQAPLLNWNGQEFPEKVEVDAFNDILRVESPTAEVLAVYDGGYYDGKPALVKNKFGNGTAYYYGGAFNLKSANLFLHELKLSSPVAELLVIPHSVEMSVRKNEDTGEALIFLLNYSSSAQTVIALKAMPELLSGDTVQGEFKMDPYGVMILSIPG
jgi:beta-galactosidase